MISLIVCQPRTDIAESLYISFLILSHPSPARFVPALYHLCHGSDLFQSWHCPITSGNVIISFLSIPVLSMPHPFLF